MADAYTRPLPVRQPESDFYWEKAQEHELWLRHCNECDAAYWYPRDFCPRCYSRSVEWRQASGRGTLHAFAIAHRGPTPPFRDHVPYITALVDLEEGVRVPTNLVGIEPDPANITIGMALEVEFDDVTEDTTLVKFKPA